MRNTLYAIVATCLAMLATSGIVALATAAPPLGQRAAVEHELSTQIDLAIARQLEKIKRDLVKR